MAENKKRKIIHEVVKIKLLLIVVIGFLTKNMQKCFLILDINIVRTV